MCRPRPCSSAQAAVVSAPLRAPASTTTVASARPLISRLRRGNVPRDGLVSGANSLTTAPPVRTIARARARCAAGYRRSWPPPITATVGRPARTAAAWAAPSIPSARPDTTVAPSAATRVADPAGGRAAELRGPPRADDRDRALAIERRRDRRARRGRAAGARSSGGATGTRRRASVSDRETRAADRLEQPRRVLRGRDEGRGGLRARGWASRPRRPSRRRASGQHRASARSRARPRRCRIAPRAARTTPARRPRRQPARPTRRARPPSSRTSAAERRSGSPSPSPPPGRARAARRDRCPASARLRERRALGRQPEPGRLVEVRGRDDRRPSRSAIVRATRRSRSVPRPLSRSRSASRIARVTSARPSPQIERSLRPRTRPLGTLPLRARWTLAGGRDPRRDDRARLRRGPADEQRGRDPVDRDPEVDPVAQRPGDPAPVALRDARRAAARGPRRPAHAARAGVHRRHER